MFKLTYFIDQLSKIPNNGSEHALVESFLNGKFEPRVTEITRLLLHHKTASHFIAFLKNYKGSLQVEKEKFLSDLNPLDEANYGEIYYNELVELIDSLNSRDIDFMLLRGAAIQELYPEECMRYMSDFEIFFNTIEEAHNAIDVFKELGFYVSSESPQIIKREYNGKKPEYQMKISMEHVDLNRRFPIDIKCGYVGSLDIKIFENCIDTYIKGRKAKIPSIENSILILADHIMEHTYYRNRDFNDIYVLINNQKVDWDYLSESSKRNCLNEVILALIDKTQKKYGRKLINVSISNKLKNNLFQRLLMKIYLKDPNEKITISIIHYIMQSWNFSQNKSLINKVSMITGNFIISLAILWANSESEKINGLKKYVLNRILTSSKQKFSMTAIQEREHIFLLPIELKSEEEIIGIKNIQIEKSFELLKSKFNKVTLLFSNTMIGFKENDLELIITKYGFYVPSIILDINLEKTVILQSLCIELLMLLLDNEAIDILIE